MSQYYFMQQDYTFMNKVITQFKQVLGVAPTGKYGNASSVDFNFAASASTMTTYNIDLNGYIAYLHKSESETIMTNIFATPPAPTTALEKELIYTVYDALGVPRPVL